MGLFNWIGIGKEISEPIRAVGELYTTDKERIAAETKYEEVIQKPVLAQLHNNSIMVSSLSLFNSGWQPLIGWTAGFLIALYWAPQIILADYMWCKICLNTGNIVPYPIKPDELMNLIYLLFGFGVYHIADRKINR